MDFADYPHVKRWYLAIADRPAVKRGWDVLQEGRRHPHAMNGKGTWLAGHASTVAEYRPCR